MHPSLSVDFLTNTLEGVALLDRIFQFLQENRTELRLVRIEEISFYKDTGFCIAMVAKTTNYHRNTNARFRVKFQQFEKAFKQK